MTCLRQMSILKFMPLGSYSLTLLNLPIQFDYLLRSSDKNSSSLWTDHDVSLTIPCGRKRVFILDFFRGFNLDFDKKTEERCVYFLMLRTQCNDPPAFRTDVFHSMKLHLLSDSFLDVFQIRILHIFFS